MLDESLPRGPHVSLVHPGSSDVTKSEARTQTGLVINHLNARCLSQLPLLSRKAQLQTLSSHRNGGLLDRVEYLSGALVMMTTASSNQTSLPAFTSLTSHAVLWRRCSAQPILLGYVAQSRSPKVRSLWLVGRRRVSPIS